MPVEVWPIVTVGGKQYYQVEGLTRIEVDPQGNIYYLVKTPDGGVGAVGPLVKGDPGLAPVLAASEVVTEIDYNDSAPATATWTLTDPGDPENDVPPTYQRHAKMRKGPPGADGDTVLNPADFDTPLPGQMIVVNPAGDGFALQAQKVGVRYFPASLNSTASGNATSTLGQIAIAAQPTACRVEAYAAAEITGTGPDVKVDLIARLGYTGISNAETAGHIVGRALGKTVGAALVDTPVMIPGPDPGASTDQDTIPANMAAMVYLRAERQTGADYFTTVGGTGTASRTRFYVKVTPVP